MAFKFRNFENDLKNSNDTVVRLEWNKYLKRRFGEDAIIKWKDECMTSQLDFGCDLLVTDKKGRRYSIDVKTKQATYSTLLLEIVHQVYRDKDLTHPPISVKPGWLYGSTADIIFFGTLDNKKIVEVCAFSLTPFKLESFKAEITALPQRFTGTEFANKTYQRTIFKIVSKDFLRKNATMYWEHKE